MRLNNPYPLHLDSGFCFLFNLRAKLAYNYPFTILFSQFFTFRVHYLIWGKYCKQCLSMTVYIPIVTSWSERVIT